MLAGPLLDKLGLFGLLLGLLGHLAYTIYRDRQGAVADIRDGVQDAHDRLDGVGVVLYRKAAEDWEDIDEDYLRDMLFNGHEVQFPTDYVDDYDPSRYRADGDEPAEPPENR